jgi:cell division protein ZipA
MQELRFVLIIVGTLAIAALLIHGLWTSHKENKSKFGDKPLNKLVEDEADSVKPFRAFQDDEQRKKRKEPGFSLDNGNSDVDPLIDSYEQPEESPFVDEEILADDASLDDLIDLSRPEKPPSTQNDVSQNDVSRNNVSEETDEAYEVVVLNVHCPGNEPFVGTKLFDSMQQNGLLYGEMDIYHRHADLSGTGKVLFSVANIMQPGTLRHDDPALFTTKGISFFMTLPCYGDPEQNFKLMLKTAQQIADDLGGNVLDDQRHLMTPDRLSEYRRQIQLFKSKTA